MWGFEREDKSRGSFSLSRAGSKGSGRGRASEGTAGPVHASSSAGRAPRPPHPRRGAGGQFKPSEVPEPHLLLRLKWECFAPFSFFHLDLVFRCLRCRPRPGCQRGGTGISDTGETREDAVEGAWRAGPEGGVLPELRSGGGGVEGTIPGLPQGRRGPPVWAEGWQGRGSPEQPARPRPGPGSGRCPLAASRSLRVAGFTPTCKAATLQRKNVRTMLQRITESHCRPRLPGARAPLTQPWLAAGGLPARRLSARRL